MDSICGHYYVTPTDSARADARKWFPRTRDYYELRKQALKLRWWPTGAVGEHGQVEDLHWEPVRGAGQSPKIHELIIDDIIGGHDNIRVYFMVAPRPLDDDPMVDGKILPRIWILRTMQKKTQKLSNNDLTTLRGRAKIILKRHYGS